eukprot:TRINITY_DN32880_c0_g2_i1.p1 TRINITY_DN32880_c0_g2~~TRINITY_DN32880_c0_g2_i1.p1  ORF type:complete len:1355 (-),score=283.65 TRINITY_DN32880_c0_g2_i1:72-4136(-)
MVGVAVGAAINAANRVTAHKGNQRQGDNLPNNRSKRRSIHGISTLDASLSSNEEDGFLMSLRVSIEAKVPNVPGPLAGTGGTGCTGEDILDSESEDECLAKNREGVDQKGDTVSVASSESGLSDQAEPLESTKRRCRIISPRDPWKVRWDVFCGIFIVYTLIAMTFRIGFDQEATGGALIFDFTVDFLFAVDTVLCFRTGYFIDQEILVTDSWEIAKKYITTFFVFDVLAWLPMGLLVQAFTGQNPSSMRSMKLMKFVRLVRLAKLMRLFKLGRFLAILEETLDLKPAMIRMVKLMAIIIFLAHLLACTWHFIALPACGDLEDVPDFGPCPDDFDETGRKPNWIRKNGVDKLSLLSRYVASFHFITATMMAVGYGEISGTNTEERIFCIVLQLFGATAFGFILSSVTSVLESANPRAQETQKRTNEIKEWCSGRQMPRQLRTLIREHLLYTLQKKSIFNEAEMLGNMPSSMRNDVIQRSYKDWLGKLEQPFKNEDLAFRIELVQMLQPQQVFQKEVMLEEGEIAAEVYVVAHGCLEVICDGNRNDLAQTKNWVTQSLMQSRLGDTLTAPIVPANCNEDDGNVALADGVIEPVEVLCGVFLGSDVVGQVVAFPAMVRGFSNRTEVLAITKDALTDLLFRFPGALKRADATEEMLKAEMVKVFESPLASSTANERSVKSLVMMRGAAVPREQLPSPMLQGDGAETIRAFQIVAPPDPPLTMPEPSSKMQIGEVNGPVGDDLEEAQPANEPQPPATPSSGRSLISSAPSVAGGHSTSRKKAVLLTTHRRHEVTGKVEIAEETEDEVTARFIIPPNHRRKLCWDVAVGILIVYSVLIIPLRICFDIEADAVATGFDVFVDIMFAIDMALCFRTGIQLPDGSVHTVPSHIVKKYLLSWFTIDFLSTFPVDRVVEAIAGDGSGNIGTQTRALKMIRMVRLVRLLKLARMLKMGKLAHKFEDMVDLSPLTLKCINLGAKLTVMSHFLGCFWFWVSTHNDSAPEQCASGLLGCDDSLPPTTWWKELALEPDQKWDQYVAAIYWAFTTMTTVGYGDIHPRSDGERVYAIIAMIVGATVFGYIIGSIAALAGQERSCEVFTKRKLSLVRNFCEEQRVSENKVKEVVKHYQFFYQERSPYNEQALLLELPSWLRKRVAKHLFREAMSRIGLFVGPQMRGLESGPMPDWFVTWCMRILEPQAVSTGEIVVNADDSSVVSELFFVYDGECEAFYQRSIWRQRSTPAGKQGGTSDTGGSIDLADEAATQDRTTSNNSVKTKTLMVFSPGCIFGLEHMASNSQRYSVRCSKAGPCLLYVLRQSIMAEVQFTCPEMVKALQKAITYLMVNQTKFRVPQKNLELRRASKER